MNEVKKQNKIFPGFPPAPVTNYWPYPKALNGWWHSLTGNEQKCLDYILRHTWGYKKDADAISISQFINGITKRDGAVIDKGTGIKNEKTVRKSLKGLVEKGFIERIDRSIIGREPIYKLKLDASQEMVPLPNSGTPPIPNNGISSTQTLAPTIKDKSIKNNNIISLTRTSQKINYSNDINELLDYLSLKLDGYSFPLPGKQAKYAKAMLEAKYSVDDIKWAIDTMLNNKWWRENSFDMKNVADEIPKLMTRTFKP